jgi:hypothetical protein
MHKTETLALAFIALGVVLFVTGLAAMPVSAAGGQAPADPSPRPPWYLTLTPTTTPTSTPTPPPPASTPVPPPTTILLPLSGQGPGLAALGLAFMVLGFAVALIGRRWAEHT